MTFYFNKVVLWLHSGDRRELIFLPNKVNVITGDSKTGKSAILQIIDYCFFASKSKIPEDTINENVSWYGVNVQINDKLYTICRSALSRGQVTNNYYFSPSGSIPVIPETNSDERTIKYLIETELGIDHNVRIPFGGTYLSGGSKISFRYFLLFTTISENIICNTNNIYFDKQDEDRYREALARIFDLAVGIDDIANIITKDKKVSLEAELRKLDRVQNRTSQKASDFQHELSTVVRTAKEYGLIDPAISTSNAIPALEKSFELSSRALVTDSLSDYNNLKSREYKLIGVIRNLKRLNIEYEEYKRALTSVEDGVRPISYLNSKKADLVETSIFREMVTALSTDLEAMKRDIKSRTPIDVNVSDIIHDTEQELLSIREALTALPKDIHSFKDYGDKCFFMGELKAKIDLYSSQTKSDTIGIQSSMEDIQSQIDSLHVRDESERKRMFIELLEELIQQYMIFVGSVLGNYAKYLPVFNYPSKALLLRKPLTDFIENVGSSSNHMFLHLFLFLGLREAIQRKSVTFVPSYLIIDQPSRPYWGDGESRKQTLNHGDLADIRKAFELLNYFMERIVNELKGSCQLIVFEHVPPSTWGGMNHVHLVEEFVGDNALIPLSLLDRDLHKDGVPEV